MSTYKYIKSAIITEHNTTYSGSFVKLQAISTGSTAPVSGDGAISSSIQTLSFGQFQTGTDANISNTQISEVHLPVGQSIEGPIFSFKTGTTGGWWLAYQK